jgi:F-type H+-transporting ATPase subunit c
MKKALWMIAGIALLGGATPAFAQEGGSGMGAANWIAITSGFSMAIASAVCGLAQAKAAAAAVEGMARNPSAAAAIRFALILSLVLIESLALYTFAIIIVKVV